MLKLEVENLEGVDEKVRDLYEEKEGKFRLKVEGVEDTGALKRAKDHEAKARKEATEKARQLEERLAEMQAQLEGIEQEKAKKGGDLDSLTKSWEGKLQKQKAELSTELDKRDGIIRSLTVGSTAQSLAAEIAVQGSAKALMPHIQSRLTMEYRDGVPTVVVLDAGGKPSAMTVEELKAEIANDPAFAPLIVASKATGAGGSGGRGGASGTAGLPKTLAECKTPQQKVAWLKAHGKVATD